MAEASSSTKVYIMKMYWVEFDLGDGEWHADAATYTDNKEEGLEHLGNRVDAFMQTTHRLANSDIAEYPYEDTT